MQTLPLKAAIAERYAMHKNNLSGLFSLLLSLILIPLLGCGTTESFIEKVNPKNLYTKIREPKPELKKKVMIVPLLDYARLGMDRANEITADFTGRLIESPYLLAYNAPQDLSAQPTPRSPELGIFTNPELIKIARDSGMNTLVTGVLNPIDISSDRKGIWPFRKSVKVFEVSLVINAMDTTSGTVVLTNLESEKVSIPLDETEVREKKDIITDVLVKSLPSILKRQAKAVTKALIGQPWTGRILAVENDLVKINAGTDVGLKVGHKFEVFARGKSITSQSGLSYRLLGKKIGVIEANVVMEDFSMAKPLAEGEFRPGQIIRFHH